MQLTYTLTLEDYKAALKLHSRQNFGRRLGSLFFNRVLPGIGILLLITEAFLAFAEKDYFSRSPGPGCLWSPLLSPFCPLYSSILSANNSSNCSPFLTEASRSILETSASYALTPGRVKADSFCGMRLRSSLKMRRSRCFTWPNWKFLFFPTSAMSPAQMAELNDLVTRHVVRKIS